MKKIHLVVVLLATVLASGCATYRTSSNITSSANPVISGNTKVLISEDSLPNRKYKVIGPIEVSVKKRSALDKDPTKEQANEVLIEKARTIGADAVINVKYESGIGWMTWGYMDAKGTGVKLED